MASMFFVRPAVLTASLAAFATAAVTVSLPQPAEAAGQSPGVSLRIITFGETRDQLQATPIEQRPYRPGHFYGNRVRRQSNRGASAPAPRSSGSSNSQGRRSS
jgi:hypothetical protein